VPNDLTTIGYTYSNKYAKSFQSVYYGSLTVESEPGSRVSREIQSGITQKEQKDAPRETLMYLPNISPRGWITKEYLQNLNEKWSAKYYKLLENVTRLSGKHAIYAENKERGGVYFIQDMLQSCGIPCLVYAGGLTDSQRKGIVGAYNTPSNDDGHLIKAFIFTSAGMTGLSLLTTRHLHQLDPISSPVEQFQFEGRVVRYKGHSRLPIDQRTVTLHQYISVVPEFDINEDIAIQINANSDIELMIKAKNGMKDLETLNNLLRDVAVDCPEYFPGNQCYIPSEKIIQEIKEPSIFSIDTTTRFNNATQAIIVYGIPKGVPFSRMPNKGSVELMKKFGWARPAKKGKYIPGPGQYERIAPVPTDDYSEYSVNNIVIQKGIDTLVWGFIVRRVDSPTATELKRLSAKIRKYQKKSGNTIRDIAIFGGQQNSLGVSQNTDKWKRFVADNDISVVVHTLP
jgi:hypothetical protein